MEETNINQIPDAKPKGIRTLAIIILILSVLAFFGTILSLVFIAGASANPELNPTSYSLTHTMIINIIGLIIHVLLIVGSIGLFIYKEWGRKVIVYTCIGVLVQNVLNMIYSMVAYSALSLIGLLISLAFSAVIYGLLIYYFTKENVKSAFV